MTRIRNLAWLSLSLVIVAVDQWTKWLAVTHLEFARSVNVLPGLDWTLLHNRGMAFSLFNDGGWQFWALTVLTVAVSAVLLVWLARTPARLRWQAASLALVLGGAVGNLVDRLRLGHVIDFIDVYYDRWHWPAFNVADSAITVGAVLLAITLFRQDRREA